MNSPAVAVLGIDSDLLSLAHAAAFADLELRGIWSPNHMESLKSALLLGTSAVPDRHKLTRNLTEQDLVLCGEVHFEGRQEKHSTALPATLLTTKKEPFWLIVRTRSASLMPPEIENDDRICWIEVLDSPDFPEDRVPATSALTRARLTGAPSARSTARLWLERLGVISVGVEEGP